MPRRAGAPLDESIPNRPIVRYSLGKKYTYIEALSQMCWPDPEFRDPRMISIAAMMIGLFENNSLKKLVNAILFFSQERVLSISDVNLMAEHAGVSQAQYDLVIKLLEDSAGFRNTDPDLVRAGLRFFHEASHYPEGWAQMLAAFDPNESALKERFLHPLGGIGAVAAAPSTFVIRQELENRFEGDALRAGLVLVTVARLQKHNESLPLASRRPASINRAISIIENEIMAPSGPKQRGAATGNATMKSWVAWRSMSPIWAGLIAAANFDLSMAALFRAAWTDDGPKRLAAYAKWFARVAGELKRVHAKGVILSAEEAVLIDVDVEEMEPALPGLTPLERKFAQEYRA